MKPFTLSVIILVASLSISNLALAKDDTHALFTCSNDVETRTLSIGEKEGGGCELHYEKNEKMKVLSWSSHSNEPCIRSRDKLIGELKSAGWKCTKTNM